MTAASPFILPSLASIRISGHDAEKLLQGQCSCDIKKVTHQQAKLGTLNNAKGKMYANFALLRAGDDFLMVLHHSIKESTLQALKKYAVFYKCTLTASEDSIAGLINPVPADLQVEQEAEHISIHWINGSQLIINAAQPNNETDEQWTRSEMQAGWMWLTSEQALEHTAPSLNMDKMGAISFDKGCYTGQEIIARTHYKGKLKKRLQLLSTTQPIHDAQQLSTAEGAAIGHILASHQTHSQSFAFAILPVTGLQTICLAEDHNISFQIEKLPYTVED